MSAVFESGSDDRVRAVVDSAGRLVDITISPELLRSPARNVAQAVFEAVTGAQRAASRPSDGTVALERQLADALGEVTVDADGLRAELARLAEDLRRDDGR
ncbi:hypothetical protein GCM10009557_94570 [Virgisporangium ochraceum]